jgi:hypothetical protein
MGRPRLYPIGINPFKVQSGQIWENLDPRHEGKKIQIMMVREDVGYAIVKRVNGMRSGFLSRVKLNNFRPNTHGYRRIK